MPYTLWSRGVLVGETDFALSKPEGRQLIGVFHPASSGMLVLPALTAMAPALFGLGAAMERLGATLEEMEDDPDGALALLDGTESGHRVMTSAREIAELELRDPDGRRLLFESILVSDLEELARAAAAAGSEVEVPTASRDAGGTDRVRFLVSATLADGDVLGERAHAEHRPARE